MRSPLFSVETTAVIAETPLAKQVKSAGDGLPVLDRTAKLFIGGKQARSDGNYTRGVYGPDGTLVGQAADGNRKDIRDAVEAAHKASGWGYRNSHARAQILYYLAENLSVRAGEFSVRVAAMTGRKNARAEVEAAIDRLFTYAAYADKYDAAIVFANVAGFAQEATVRIHWSTPMAAEIPWYVTEVPTVFVSLSLPNHLIDVPMVKTVIHAHAPSREAIRAVVEKIQGKSPFQGTFNENVFCDTFGTRL